MKTKKSKKYVMPLEICRKKMSLIPSFVWAEKLKNYYTELNLS